MAEQNPYTLVRVGIIETSLLPTLQKFNLGFIPIKSVMGNTEQYAFYGYKRDPYLIQVSRSLFGIHPEYNYNLIVSVISEKDDRSYQIMDEFSKNTGVELRKAPSFLDGLLSISGSQLFPMLKKAGSNWTSLAKE